MPTVNALTPGEIFEGLRSAECERNSVTEMQVEEGPRSPWAERPTESGANASARSGARGCGVIHGRIHAGSSIGPGYCPGGRPMDEVAGYATTTPWSPCLVAVSSLMSGGVNDKSWRECRNWKWRECGI